MSETNIESNTSTRPSFIEDEHLEFLNDLRRSGATNMFGAIPYIEREFQVSRKEAANILSYWMKSFGKEDR